MFEDPTKQTSKHTLWTPFKSTCPAVKWQCFIPPCRSPCLLVCWSAVYCRNILPLFCGIPLSDNYNFHNLIINTTILKLLKTNRTLWHQFHKNWSYFLGRCRSFVGYCGWPCGCCCFGIFVCHGCVFFFWFHFGFWVCFSLAVVLINLWNISDYRQLRVGQLTFR